MNLCFLIGKVYQDVRFEFILNSKNKSIAVFQVELSNKNVVTVKAYNELADFCYQHLKRNTILGIKGYLNGKNEIVIEEVEEYGKRNIKVENRGTNS